MYEMIILFRPYGTPMAYIMQHGGMAYIMQHGGMAYIMQHGGMAYGPLAQGRRAYNERARARVAYTMPMRYGCMSIIPWGKIRSRVLIFWPAPHCF